MAKEIEETSDELVRLLIDKHQNSFVIMGSLAHALAVIMAMSMRPDSSIDDAVNSVVGPLREQVIQTRAILEEEGVFSDLQAKIKILKGNLGRN